MPRFHYVVRTDTHVLLSDSVDLPSLERARLEASRRVGDLLKTHSEAIWADKEWQMDVTDEVGLILFVICISAMKSAATHSAKQVQSMVRRSELEQTLSDTAAISVFQRVCIVHHPPGTTRR